MIVLDSRRAHKFERVRKLIYGKGSELLCLSPYSADLNPIGEAFSKVKAAAGVGRGHAPAKPLSRRWDGRSARSRPRTPAASDAAASSNIGITGHRSNLCDRRCNSRTAVRKRIKSPPMAGSCLGRSCFVLLAGFC